jgi:hypothetical protein
MVLRGLGHMIRADTAVELVEQEHSVALYIEVVAGRIGANEEEQMG